jgi:hypothetical protein
MQGTLPAALDRTFFNGSAVLQRVDWLADLQMAPCFDTVSGSHS